jgi:hypothetical protein
MPRSGEFPHSAALAGVSPPSVGGVGGRCRRGEQAPPVPPIWGGYGGRARKRTPPAALPPTMDPSYSLNLCFQVMRELGLEVNPQSQGPFDRFYRTGCSAHLPNSSISVSVQTDPRVCGWAICEVLGPEPAEFNATEREMSMYGVLRFETLERFREYLEVLIKLINNKNETSEFKVNS